MSQTYKRRQLYVIMCGQLVNEDLEMFNKYFKGDLLQLAFDKVITVRMALARLLVNQASIAADPEVQNTLNKLKKDSCGDIRELVNSGYDELMKQAKDLQ